MSVYHLIFLLWASAAAVLAADGTDPYDHLRDDAGSFQYDERLEVPWVESESEVLRLPDDDQLLRFELESMPRGMSLFLDMDRMVVNPKDRITRTWVVAKSRSGGYQASYEGFRCETGEYKVYAYGNPKRKVPVRKTEFPRWNPVSGRSHDYRSELLNVYLCSGITARQPEEIRAVVQSGFTSDRPLFDITNM